MTPPLRLAPVALLLAALAVPAWPQPAESSIEPAAAPLIEPTAAPSIEPATAAPATAPQPPADGSDTAVPSTWSGRHLMEQVRRRSGYLPYIYQEQSMVLLDAAGHRDTRRTRHYSRLDPDGRLHLLLVFDYPAEVRGVALLATREPSGAMQTQLYLPALGPEMRTGDPASSGRHFLGTDFAVPDLIPEALDQYRYERHADEAFDRLEFFVVDALPLAPDGATGYGRRRHFIRKDLSLITRTDFFDAGDRLIKRLNHYDIQEVDGGGWAPAMSVMEDLRERHQTLLRVERLVYSSDYVPATIFTPEWLLANRHVHPPDGAPPPLKPAAAECRPNGGAR